MARFDMLQTQTAAPGRTCGILQGRDEFLDRAIDLREVRETYSLSVITPSSASSRQKRLNVSNMLTPPVWPK